MHCRERGHHLHYSRELRMINETALIIPNNLKMGRGLMIPNGGVVRVAHSQHNCSIHIFASAKCSEDFTAYADVCFREFGGRVTYWTTVNEPNIGAMASYGSGQIPPGRCSDPFGITKCTAGNSSTEPYIAVHTMLLAHASVAKLYKEKYQVSE